MSQHPLVSGKAGEHHLLLGNEAIVRGALEAGVHVVTCYPGTPSSDVVETFYHLKGEMGDRRLCKIDGNHRPKTAKPDDQHTLLQQCAVFNQPGTSGINVIFNLRHSQIPFPSSQ